ncbi:GNAT family N-acetyltransferase [Kitasatospora sp. NPDC088134]|uniref:GNAT family N-acetyltransferase n=1 Tax=Kitasatospora sp. NPDC088134 TaxID=3364071 RepID=UPI0037FCAAE7
MRPDTWNRGCATLAVRHLLGPAQRFGVSRVYARHHPDDPASGRVLIKAGFAPTGAEAGFPTCSTTLPRRLTPVSEASPTGPRLLIDHA